MDQPKSAARPRFRALRQNRRRLLPLGHDPPDAQEDHPPNPFILILNFVDRLLRARIEAN
jgi:hypothetical protein